MFLIHLNGVPKNTPYHLRNCFIKQNTTFWFDNIYNHFYQRFWCKENAIIRCNIFSKFIKEIFIDTPNNISAYFIKCTVIKNTKKL